jgi:hypothetical protein
LADYKIQRGLQRKASTICDGIRDLQDRMDCSAAMDCSADADSPTVQRLQWTLMSASATARPRRDQITKRPDHAGFGSQQQDFGRDRNPT